MQRLIGIIFVLIGGGVMLFGIGVALTELVGMYDRTLADPLAAGEVSEVDVSRRMIHAAIVGAAGVPVFIIGTVLLKISYFRRKRLGRRA